MTHVLHFGHLYPIPQENGAQACKKEPGGSNKVPQGIRSDVGRPVMKIRGRKGVGMVTMMKTRVARRNLLPESCLFKTSHYQLKLVILVVMCSCLGSYEGVWLPYHEQYLRLALASAHNDTARRLTQTDSVAWKHEDVCWRPYYLLLLNYLQNVVSKQIFKLSIYFGDCEVKWGHLSRYRNELRAGQHGIRFLEGTRHFISPLYNVQIGSGAHLASLQ
jgi:hypothetical protein